MAFSLYESWRRANVLRNQLSTENVKSSAAVVGASGPAGGPGAPVAGGVGRGPVSGAGSGLGASLGVPSAGGAGNKTHARVGYSL